MANEFTSILTGGYSDNTVKTAYDLAFGMVLRETPTYRNWVSKGPTSMTQPGQSIVLQKYDWFNAAAVTAAKTPLNEETDVDSRKLPATVPVTLTVNEYGDAVTATKKLRVFSMGDIDTYAAMAVANHCSEVLDELVQDVLVGGTQVIRGGAKAATNLVTASDKLVAADVRKARTKLVANKVVPWNGRFYAGGAHPHVIHDLREETGSGSWRVPTEYGASQANIWSGEIGEFEGIRFVENTRTRKATDGASSAVVYRTFFQGREALAERVVEEPNVVLGPVTDKLQRFRTVGWYGILGWVLYRNEALVVGQHGSSVAAL